MDYRNDKTIFIIENYNTIYNLCISIYSHHYTIAYIYSILSHKISKCRRPSDSDFKEEAKASIREEYRGPDPRERVIG